MCSSSKKARSVAEAAFSSLAGRAWDSAERNNIFHYCNDRAVLQWFMQGGEQSRQKWSAVVSRTCAGSFRLSHDNLSYEDLLRIVELIKTSEQFSEFRLKVGEIEIELRRHTASDPPKAVVDARPLSRESASSRAPSPIAHLEGAQTEPLTSGLAPPRATPTWPEGSIVIRAPMVGVFYRAPEPGAPPFIDRGQHVEPDTIVCIIEVMKLMNSIPAGASGTVMDILVDDAAPVEFGQPLIVLQPEAEPE